MAASPHAQGGAHDYPPYYKRFLKNPLEPCYMCWLPRHIFSASDMSAMILLERPKDFYRFIDNYVPVFKGSIRIVKRGAKEPETIFTRERDRLIKLAIIALRLRAAFRRLAHLWIWRKAAATALPETDIITMCEFEKPVIYTDMLQRRRYKFEAGPLIAHIKNQLEYVSFGFVEPLWPRNPTTNLPFSSAQLHVIYKQCLAAGKMNATFATFAECKFSLVRFMSYYGVPLALNYNLSNVRNISSEVGQEILLDYILEISEMVTVKYTESQRRDLEYGLLHYGDCAFFKKWRELFCKQQNLQEIDGPMLVTASYLNEVRFSTLNKFRVERLAADSE